MDFFDLIQWFISQNKKYIFRLVQVLETIRAFLKNIHLPNVKLDFWFICFA